MWTKISHRILWTEPRSFQIIIIMIKEPHAMSFSNCKASLLNVSSSNASHRWQVKTESTRQSTCDCFATGSALSWPCPWGGSRDWRPGVAPPWWGRTAIPAAACARARGLVSPPPESCKSLRICTARRQQKGAKRRPPHLHGQASPPSRSPAARNSKFSWREHPYRTALGVGGAHTKPFFFRKRSVLFKWQQIIANAM